MAKGTKHAIVENESDRRRLCQWLDQQEPPFTVSYTPGKHRTNPQNKLQRKWCKELEQQGDMSAEEYRGYCKLHFGVPILCRDNEAFRLQYKRMIKQQDYWVKLIYMMEPFDFAITRHMNTKQKAEYLDAIYTHFTGEGFTLTIPKSMEFSQGEDNGISNA